MTSSEKKLQRIFSNLSTADQETLLAFAEFLQARTPSFSASLSPQLLSPPPNESVIAAIKRLSNSYPMLDRAKLLNETSVLMSEHVLQGRHKVEVIEQLEAIFLRHYEELTRQQHQVEVKKND